MFTETKTYGNNFQKARICQKSNQECKVSHWHKGWTSSGKKEEQVRLFLMFYSWFASICGQKSVVQQLGNCEICFVSYCLLNNYGLLLTNEFSARKYRSLFEVREADRLGRRWRCLGPELKTQGGGGARDAGGIWQCQREGTKYLGRGGEMEVQRGKTSCFVMFRTQGLGWSNLAYQIYDKTAI